MRDLKHVKMQARHLHLMVGGKVILVVVHDDSLTRVGLLMSVGNSMFLRFFSIPRINSFNLYGSIYVSTVGWL